MSTILPKKPLDKITFCETHHTAFSTHAAQIGTTPAKVTTLQALTAAARAAYLAQQEAKTAARTATNTYVNAVVAMAGACTSILKDVKAKAGSSPDPDAIYGLAQVPPPSAPSPVPAPGMPTDFRVTLAPDGALELAWKCAHPKGAVGTIYQVSRRTGSVGEFQIIGGSGTRKFVDATVPAGVASVTYRVQAIRSTQVGTANAFTVNFGVTGSGEATASVAASPKLAA